jgi:hypothetical protein
MECCSTLSESAWSFKEASEARSFDRRDHPYTRGIHTERSDEQKGSGASNAYIREESMD